MFVVDSSSSVHAYKRNKDILILGKGPTDGLDDNTETLEAENSINLCEKQQKFPLSSCYLFVNGVRIYQFKAKDCQIKQIELCLASFLKDFRVDYIKMSGFYGYVYDFSVDYDNINISNITNIHKYLMKKNNIL